VNLSFETIVRSSPPLIESKELLTEHHFVGKMGQKAETLLQEILLGTAFLGGIWVAMEMNPNVVIIEQLGKIIATVGTESQAEKYVGRAKLLLTVSFLVSLAGSFLIGKLPGLAAFGAMWLAGILFFTTPKLAIILLFVGMGLGIYAVHRHTDENIHVSTQPRF